MLCESCSSWKYSVLFLLSRADPKISTASLKLRRISLSLRKHAFSNILKILPPKNENFQIKKSDIFLISAQKHSLWVLGRTASARRF